MSNGARDGALFLIVVAGVIAMAIARFGYRLWVLERAHPAPEARR